MPVRRHTDPNNVQHIWDAIKAAQEQHANADHAKISKYLQTITFCTQEQADLYITQAMADHFIIETKKIGTKGSIDIYKVPLQESPTLNDSGNDWYCIDCHLAGDVEECAACHHVFHAECGRNMKRKLLLPNMKRSAAKQNIQNKSVPKDHNENKDLSDDIINLDDSFEGDDQVNIQSNKEVYNELLCTTCNWQLYDYDCTLDKQNLNHLLQFTLDRIKSWLPANITHKMDPEQQKYWTDSELEWRANKLWCRQADMKIMQEKIRNNAYSSLSNFIADVVTIHHNVAIFHGFESQEYGAAELMLRDCCHDLSELRVCADCYRHSNEKKIPNWFCLPCKNPHKLVWAKQKGYPYWPAKVIKELETTYDVRFFGGKYERSVLPRNNVKPIETPQDKLQIKVTASFKKALEELRQHQKLLRDPSAVNEFISASKLKKSVQNRRLINGSSGSSLKSPKLLPTGLEKGDVYAYSESPESSLISPRAPKRKALLDAKKKPAIMPKKERRSRSGVGNENGSSSNNLSIGIPSSDPDDTFNISSKDHSHSFDQVTSSTEYCINLDDTTENVMHELDKPYSDAIEKMRRKLEVSKDKNQLITIAMNYMREEIDRIESEHADYVKKLVDGHAAQLSETKRKQWCYNCQQDAIYHCCWNTSYCSPSCQQQHWQAEHKKVCRRKREK